MATLMAGPLDAKEMWLTNILLLGFDRLAQERQYNVHFTRDMFAVPNQKGMEVVLHHLFSQLNSHLCYEEFRDCWPVFDKKQEQLFRKKSCSWLANISKEDPGSAISRSTGSLLLSPAGDRFYQLLELFSAHCVRAVLLREVVDIEKVVFVPQSVRRLGSCVAALPEVMEHSTKLHIIRHSHHTTQRLRDMTNLHEEWRQYSCSLIERYRHSSRHTRELEESLASFKQQRHPRQIRGVTSPRGAAGSQPLDRKTKTVRQLWTHVDRFVADTSSQCEVVDSILLQAGSNKLTITGAGYSTQVPELISNRFSEQDQPLMVVDGKGKVDLIELTKLWTAAIQLVTDTLRANGGLPDLSRDEEYIQEQLPVQLNSLAEIQNMRGALPLLRGKVEESIRERQAVLEQLRMAATKGASQEESPLQQDEERPLITIPSLSVAPVGYQLLPPTPHKATPQSPPPTPYYMRPSLTKTVSTPDAVRSISQQIARASQHHRPPTSSIPVPSSAHPLTHSTTAAAAAARHTPTTPHRTTITSTHKPSSHKKRRGQSTMRGLTRKGHTAARQTDQEPVVSSSKGDLSSSPGIPAARTVFSPSSEALASHIADIVSGVRTTPVSFLPSHLTYATPQSPSEAFVSKDKIQRTPLSPAHAPGTSKHCLSPSLSSPQPVTSSQQQAPSITTTSQRITSSRHHSTPLSTLTKTPVSFTTSVTHSPRGPLTEHNHTDMFLSSSSFQLVDSDSDDSILLSDSPAAHSKQETVKLSSSPPIGLLINLRDSPLH